MGYAAMFEILMKNEKIQEIVSKIPGLNKFLLTAQEISPLLAEAMKPLTPEQQVIQALTLLSANMPVDKARAEAFRKATWEILGGVDNLKQALKQ